MDQPLGKGLLYTTDAAVERVRRKLLWLVVFGILCIHMSYTVMIPESYDLVQIFGGGAADSGALCSVAYLPCALGLVLGRWCMEPWSQVLCKRVLIATSVYYSLSACLAAVFISPMGRRFIADTRFYCIMGLFLARGVFHGGYTALAKVMILKIIPKTEYVFFTTLWTAGTTLGLGLGPALSSIVCYVFDIQDVEYRAAVPQLFVAVAFFAITILQLWEIPQNIQGLLAVTDYSPPSEALTPHARQNLAAKRHIWCAASLFGLERALIVSSLEVASAMLMEKEFGLPTGPIGLIIGATFMIGWPLMWLIRRCRGRGGVSDGALLCILTLASLASTPLFFTATAAALTSGGMYAFLPIVLGDVLIFPTAYVANGIADGLQAEFAIPNSLYSQENAVVGNNILQNTIGRFIGPPIARYLISVGGQDTYASAQFVLALASLFGALSMRSALRTAQCDGGG